MIENNYSNYNNYNNCNNSNNHANDLKLDKWLQPMGRASDRIYTIINKSYSLFGEYDPKIKQIYISWTAEPSLTIGDANVSEDEKIKQKYSKEMNAATDRCVKELNILYNKLIAELEEEKENSSASNNTEKNINNNQNSIFDNNENNVSKNTNDTESSIFDFQQTLTDL